MLDSPGSNRGVGKDVLALRELRTDLLGEVGEPLLSLAVTLVHGGEVLHSSHILSVHIRTCC